MTSSTNNLFDSISDTDKQDILNQLNSVESLAQDITIAELEDLLVAEANPVCEAACDVAADEMDARCKKIEKRIPRMVCRIAVKSWKARCKKKCKDKP